MNLFVECCFFPKELHKEFTSRSDLKICQCYNSIRENWNVERDMREGGREGAHVRKLRLEFP